MNTLIVSSMSRGAGKTCFIAGLMDALGKRAGYAKPFGNRLVYQRKTVWDYDAAFMNDAFDLGASPQDMSLGFEHSRIKYAFDQKKTEKKLAEMVEKAGRGKKLVVVEGGSDLMHGTSVGLDAISMAKASGCKLVLVASGEGYDVLDDILFFKKYVNAKGVKSVGFLINKVKDAKDFRQTHLPQLKKEGVEVLGVLPELAELSHFRVGYLEENLAVKNLTGEKGRDKLVKNVFLGAMSANAAHKNPSFRKTHKLVITSGDRSDMILAALEGGTSCVVLTNDIMPHTNIISKAAHAGVPLLLTPMDTYAAATQIERLEPLLTRKDSWKIELLSKAVKKNADLKKILPAKRS